MGFVIGTRPEAIKLAPIVLELARCRVALQLYQTGQHPGLDLADHGMERHPSIALGCKGQRDPLQHAEDVAAALRHHWRRDAPELIIVQGNTSSALGGARAAAMLGIPLAHVEAGLRSFDPASPWPEEQFRIEIDHLSDLLFAPTAIAATNLHRERCDGTLHVTGISGIDALRAQLTQMPHFRRRRASSGSLNLLVSCHRRENWGAGVASVATALIMLARRGDVTVAVVLHPNPQVARVIFTLLSNEPRIRLVAPLGHAGSMQCAVPT